MSRNKWQWKHNSKPMGCSKSNSKREVYSNQSYLKKQEKHQIYNLTLHQKQLEKENQKNPKISRRKEIIYKDPSRNKGKRNERNNRKY